MASAQVAPVMPHLLPAAGQEGGCSPTKTPMRHFSSAFAMSSLDEGYSQKVFPVKVVTFLYFQKPLDLEHTRAVLRDRLCSIARFRSRVIETAARQNIGCAFQELIEVELEKAMHQLVQQHDMIKTQTDVDSFVSELTCQNMDPNLPMWRGWVLNDMADGRSALMLVIDHSIGDGVALVQVLMSVLDACPRGVPSVPSRRLQAASSPGCFAQLKGLLQACWGPLIGDQMPADPPNRLKVKNHKAVSPVKSFATSEALSMDQIREVRDTLGGATVNDVLMTLTALTLQDYYRKYEPQTLKQKVRGNFPINLRSVTGEDIMAEEHFGNRFSQGQLRFPLHKEDPLKVFEDIKAQIDMIKVSPEPLVRDKILRFAVLQSGLSRNTVADLLLDAFGKVTAMLSNVPGPLETVHFLGQPLDDLTFYAVAPLGLYFGIVQYKGSFKVGICCDAACEPEPMKLAECWMPAFERLRQAAVAQQR